jgi:alpha-1,3-glucan synthase
MKRGLAGVVIASLFATSSGWPYDDALTPYNLNTNQDTTDPLQYTPVPWPGHTYFPSPTNWRALPVYTLFLDRFVNGDPQSDNINLTVYEHDLHSTQMRHGGDVVGLVDTLDYLQGMGIKVRRLFFSLHSYRI